MMKLFPAFGVALVASFALVALTAASASALSYVPANGKYQPFSVSSTSGVLFDQPGSGAGSQDVTCSGTTGSGQFSSGTSGNINLYFSNCQNSYAWSCTTKGQATGAIVASTHQMVPVYLNAAHTKYGLRIGGGKPFAEFYCGGFGPRVFNGTITVEITNPLNVNTASFNAVLNPTTQTATWELGEFYGLSEGSNAISPYAGFKLNGSGGAEAKFIP